MQGGCNLFFLAISGKIEEAKKIADKSWNSQFSNPEYDNGYYQGLKDAHELALEIRHSKDYFE